MSYSQLDQDLEVIRYYKDKKKGYFVDIGAHDGVSFSNTYLLEKDYEWTGICIEPLPNQFEKLISNRTCLCIDKPLYSEIRDVNFLCGSENRKETMLSGIVEHIDTHMFVKNNGSNLAMRTTTLTEVLDTAEAPKFIEYMSLDTEGSELEILKGIDFNKYTFGYINIEHNYQEPRRSQMRELLVSNGYQFLRQNQFDDDYIYPID